MYSVILDLEATCWSDSYVSRVPEIIEIGACRVDPYRRVVATFSKVVKPVRNQFLSPYCKTLTGIEQIEIDRAKYFNDVLLAFLDWCEYDEIEPINLYTWGKKDESLLVEACHSFKMDTEWLGEHIDLKAAYGRIKQLPRLVGLDRALLNEGFIFEGARHRALPDAANLTKLYIKYYEEFNA